MTGDALYEYLGVTTSATASEIKTAYRLLAMKSHPAHRKGPEALAQFARVSEAYAALSNAEGRRQYDERIQSANSSGPSPYEQVTQAQAERMFAKEMSALAWELSDAGYRKEFIEQALAEEGCPVALAVAAAAGAVPESRGNGEQQAVVKSQSATQRSERAPHSFDDSLPKTSGRAGRAWWLPIGASLVVCILAYSFGYRPYIAAKEEEARRIVAERELAAARVAKMAVDEKARAAEDVARSARQRLEEERGWRGQRLSELRMEEERLRAKDEAFKERVRRELKGKRIACHCKPKRCHLDWVAKVANGEVA